MDHPSNRVAPGQLHARRRRHPLPDERPVPRLRGCSERGPNAVPRGGRDSLLRAPGGEGRARLPPARRQPGRRHGLPSGRELASAWRGCRVPGTAGGGPLEGRRRHGSRRKPARRSGAGGRGGGSAGRGREGLEDVRGRHRVASDPSAGGSGRRRGRGVPPGVQASERPRGRGGRRGPGRQRG